MSTYTFRLLKDPDRTNGMGGLLMHPMEKLEQLMEEDRFGAYKAQFQGALISLFGQPTIRNSELDYEYTIEAQAGEQRWLLMAYQADDGFPDIGGDASDETVYAAAQALLTLIEETRPADYEIITDASDYDRTVRFGCANGVCYWQSIPGKADDTDRSMLEQ